MATRHRKRSLLAPLVSAAIALAAIGYFAHHARIGLDTKHRLEADGEAVKTRLEAVRGEREALERRVSLLRDEALDRDMLDERARVILNFGQAADVVVLRGAHEQIQAVRRP